MTFTNFDESGHVFFFLLFALVILPVWVKSVPIALPSLGTYVYNVRLIATDVVGGFNGVYEL